MKNGTIGNGSIFRPSISQRIGNPYVKRPEPITIACTSSSASCASSITASQTVSFNMSLEECSSVSSSITSPNLDKFNYNKRKQDALFNEMLQKAPKHPQR